MIELKTPLDYQDNSFYKYRSLENFERFLDIIVKKRLYGAVYSELNDPMEGRFDHKNVEKEELSKIFDQLKRTRICSLLLKQDNQELPDDFLMWSHYANSHKGCCIEITLTGQHNTNWRIIPVTYNNELPKVEQDTSETINNIVSVKNTMWDSENEVRAVRQYKSKETFNSNSPFYHVNIIAVYFGMKISAEKAKFYSKIIKSMNKKIRVFKVEASRENNGLYPKLIKEEI